MTSHLNFFNKSKSLAVDRFFENVLFKKKHGYYSSKYPFGFNGDFLTSPGISNLFSEIIGIWIVSSWQIFGKPKIFNVVELGPGDGKLTKILIKTFKRFPEFKKSTNIFLYEKSILLRNLQKKNIKDPKVNWINDFKKIKKGPIIFFGNEFFDAIPIKHFLRKNKLYFEKHYSFNKRKEIYEVYKKASDKDIRLLKKFKTLKKLNFIEFPKSGLRELNKIITKISKLSGGILLIDYGYLNPQNVSTLQSVMKHKKNNLLDNLGQADVTSLVNFKLLKEFFSKKNLKLKKVIPQKIFLQKMGIIDRANILSKKMNFKEKSDLYFRLKRLLDIKQMGNLFKVIFAYKSKKDNFLGF